MSFISRLLKPTTPSGGQQHVAPDGDLSGPPAHHQPEQKQQPQPQQPRRRPEPDILQIVIRGDSSVGKSCLLGRLQGQPFVEDYVPTEKPHAASVRWNCEGRCATLTVWDAVDAGRPRRARSGLKLANESSEERAVQRQVSTSSSNGDDSSLVDPYKGCHGAILMFDMTKSWTLAYVERELARAPRDLPLLVLANHRDMGHHRTVTSDQARMAIRESGRPPELTRYSESSMRNGFGLKYVHRFLCLPYLCTQRQRIVQRLSANAEDSATAVLELQLEEDEAKAAEIDGTQCDASLQSAKLTEGSSNSAGQEEDSRPPTAAAAPAPSLATTSRLSAPPARLIPGAEQYLMELRKSSAAQRPSQQPPQPPSPRPEPTGAPAPDNVLPSVDKRRDDAPASGSGSQRLQTPETKAATMATAEEARKADSSDEDDGASPVIEILAVQTTVDGQDVAESADDDNAAEGEPPTLPVLPPPVFVDWGPLLAKYEDPEPSPQPQPQEQQQQQAKQPRKQKKKDAARGKQQQQQEQQEQQQQQSQPSRKKKKASTTASRKNQKDGIQSAPEPASVKTQLKPVMTKEEEELERFLNE